MITTIAELDRIRDDSKRLVTTRSMMSAGAAVVPIPGADIVADIGLLTKLLPEISKRFGLDPVSQRDAFAEDVDVLMHLLNSDEQLTVTTDRYTLRDARLHLKPYSEIEMAVPVEVADAHEVPHAVPAATANLSPFGRAQLNVLVEP